MVKPELQKILMARITRYFFGFAPRHQPKIAIAVYIENAGWGGSFATPVAGLMIEKYLKGEIIESRKHIETKMMEADLIHTKS